jgi:hypothetical protein
MLIAPRCCAVARPGQQRIDHRVVHQRQRRIVADQNLFGRRAEHRRKQPASFDQSLRAAVIVPEIIAVFGPALLRLGDRGQQLVGKRNLFGRRLAARQIERCRASLDRGVTRPLAIPKCAQCVGRKLRQFARVGSGRNIRRGHRNILFRSSSKGPDLSYHIPGQTGRPSADVGPVDTDPSS